MRKIPNYLYAYTHSSSASWKRSSGEQGEFAVKVGQSKKQGLERVKSQLITAFPKLQGVNVFFHSEQAVGPDGEEFTDRDVHRVLEAAGVERVGGEWFAATVAEVRSAILSIQTGQPFELKRTLTFEPRPEQVSAVRQTANYFRTKGKKFLWNAKMRFGKTFTAYLLAEEMNWSRVLVLTYKPAVRSAWKRDLLTHVRFKGWQFVDSTTPAEEAARVMGSNGKVVWFASFQDVTGKSLDGEMKPRNELIIDADWDCLIIDEFHFGASTPIARELYDPQSKIETAFAKYLDGISGENEEVADVEDNPAELKSEFQLHLSGTPYKALARGDYSEDQIFEWTYTQEQKKKAELQNSPQNPYASLPTIEMYSYKLDGELTLQAIDNGYNEFSLRNFFEANRTGNGNYEFKRPEDVDRFLNLIRGVGVNRMDEEFNVDLYPYSGSKFNKGVKHSIWLLSNVAQCEAMYAKLVEHPYYSRFQIHKAVGTQAGIGEAALPPVRKSIEASTQFGKLGTITLSCGKLMTGVTVEEWSSIFMLTSLRAPESYFQAAFRVQSPWINNGKIEKETCYVFEFNPDRALGLVASYGSQLALNAPDQNTTQKSVLDDLVRYLPIYAIADGEMEMLNAESLIEWVNAGLTSNSLARRIMSPANFNLDSKTLEKITSDQELVEELMQMDDFRDFYSLADKVISSSERLKKAKRQNGSARSTAVEKQKLTKARSDLRKKLRKLNARLTLFMYLTDFREEKLEHIISALDADLFLLATGMNLATFKKLSSYGVFKTAEMTETIQKYRYFERQSLLAHNIKSPQA